MDKFEWSDGPRGFDLIYVDYATQTHTPIGSPSSTPRWSRGRAGKFAVLRSGAGDASFHSRL